MIFIILDVMIITMIMNYVSITSILYVVKDGRKLVINCAPYAHFVNNCIVYFI